MPAELTIEYIERCKAAMTKPGPLQALRTLASGRVVVEVSYRDGHVLIDTVDGKEVRDPDHPDRMMGLAGAWALYPAGMIDQFGVVTAAGHAVLRSAAGAHDRG